jgi:hypothetical protein
MWDADPLGFMREQARMDPPVVSYTSLAKQDTEELILGAKVLVKKGTTREMCISVANRDRTVFGDDVGALISPSHRRVVTIATRVGRPVPLAPPVHGSLQAAAFIGGCECASCSRHFVGFFVCGVLCGVCCNGTKS